MNLVAWKLFLLFQINWAQPKETSFPHCKWSNNQCELPVPHSLEHSHFSQEQLFEIVHVALDKEAQASCKCYSFIAPSLLNLDNYNRNDGKQVGEQTKEEPLCFISGSPGILLLVTKSKPRGRVQNDETLNLHLHREELGVRHRCNFAKWSKASTTLTEIFLFCR